MTSQMELLVHQCHFRARGNHCCDHFDHVLGLKRELPQFDLGHSRLKFKLPPTPDGPSSRIYCGILCARVLDQHLRCQIL